MSEAFVDTLRRDCLDGADRSTATRALEQIMGRIADYNEHAPHSALRYRSPLEYRCQLRSTAVRGCLTK
jgi:putative transposase